MRKDGLQAEGMTGVADSVLQTFGWFILHSLWLALFLLLVLSLIFKICSKLTPHRRYTVAWYSLLVLLTAAVTLSFNQRSIENLVIREITNAIVEVEDIFNAKNKWIGKEYKQSSERFLTAYRVERSFRALSYVLGLVWVVFVLGILMRHLYAWLRLSLFLKKAKKIPDDLLREWIRDSGFEPQVYRTVFLAHPGIESPFVFGFLAPKVIVPESYVSRNDPIQLRAVVMHEIAHIERRDTLMNLILVTAETLFFINPFTRWLLAFLREERECCCDEIAAQAVGNRFTYARALLAMQKRSQFAGNQFLIGMQKDSFSLRIERLCNPTRVRVSETKNRISLIPFFSLFLCFSVVYAFAQGSGFGDQTKPNQSQDIRNQLLAAYDLDGDALDAIGGHHGILIGGTPTINRHGEKNGALELNGISDFVKVPDFGGLEAQPVFTASCWIKTDYHDKKWMAWLAKSNFDNKRSQWRIGFGTRKGEWGFTQFTEAKGEERDRAWFDSWSTGVSFNDQWTHMTAVVHEKEGWVKLYVNGELTGKINHVQPSVADNSPLYIGYQQDDKHYFKGAIDDVRIYKTSLSDSQIRFIYQSERAS